MLQRIYQHLRRRTTSGRVIEEVDGLRFVAIMLVWVYHASGTFAKRTMLGHSGDYVGHWIYRMSQLWDYGVPLFFAISGFILGLPFAARYLRNTGHPVDLKRYFMRRITRLEPPYVLSLALFAALLVIVNHVAVSEITTHFFASLFYVHNLVYQDVSSINGVAWSLEVEVQFYILMPLLANVYRIKDKRIRRTVMIGAILLAATGQSWWGIETTICRLTLLGRIQHFIVGLLMADIFLTDWQEEPTQTSAWDVLVPLAAVLLYGANAVSAIAYQFAVPFVTLMLMYAMFRGRNWRRFLSIGIVSTIGGMCYSIYLLHSQVISLISRPARHLVIGDSFILNYVIQLSLFLIPTLLICGLFFVLIERPCMDKEWPSKLANFVRSMFGKTKAD